MASMTLSDFTSICDRNYFISCLTPSIIFILIISYFTRVLFPQLTGSNLTYYNHFGELMTTLHRSLQDLGIGNIITLALGAWIVSLILMILNLQLIMIFEGRILILKSFFLHRQQKKFKNLVRIIEQIDSLNCYKIFREEEKTKEKVIESMNEYGLLKAEEKTKEKMIELIKNSGLQMSEIGIKNNELKKIKKDEICQRIELKRTELTYELRTKYPKEYSRLLPTSFGNIICSFQSYPTSVYNIDAAGVWSRIIQFASEDHKKSINDIKSQVDFTVNLCFILLILFLEYIIFSVITWSHPMIGVPVILLIFAWLSYKLSLDLAISWGEDIKAVFDLYRHDLLKKMNVHRMSGTEKEKWEKMDWLFLYWVPLEESKDK